MSGRDYLSIGEVLAQLLEEFPDVTISKIRFLESQGLIEPERTASGYRQFTDAEVERLRVILREQKAHFLPLRVIKDRLDDETSDISRELRLVSDGVIRSDAHPAARAAIPRGSRTTTTTPPLEQDVPASIVARERKKVASRHADQTESLPREVLLARCSIDADFLKELEGAGLVNGHDVGDTTFFEPHSVEIARVAGRFRDLGIDIRHLRAWKTSAERELSLFEQRILPLLRARSATGRDEATEMLAELVELGADLRASLLARGTARLIEPR
ncbi:MAG: MerR family transcriptional regulator [Ilumatobacteraceae bacterium]